jgi:hypothetical protein
VGRASGSPGCDDEGGLNNGGGVGHQGSTPPVTRPAPAPC